MNKQFCPVFLFMLESWDAFTETGPGLFLTFEMGLSWKTSNRNPHSLDLADLRQIRTATAFSKGQPRALYSPCDMPDVGHRQSFFMPCCSFLFTASPSDWIIQTLPLSTEAAESVHFATLSLCVHCSSAEVVRGSEGWKLNPRQQLTPLLGRSAIWSLSFCSWGHKDSPPPPIPLAHFAFAEVTQDRFPTCSLGLSTPKTTV